MSTCVEAVAPSQNIPECLPALEQAHFVFPFGPSSRAADPVPQTELVDPRPTLIASAVAGCGRLNLCLHSEGGGFEDVYLTFAGSDGQNPEFEEMLRWLRANIACGRGASVSMGIGGSRVVAAIAARVAPAGGECIVVPGTEESFLAPRSVQKLRGLVQIETRALAERGITTMGQLRQIPKPVLISAFGETPGEALWDAARGRDAKKPGDWKPTSLPRPTEARGTLTGQPGWLQRVSLVLRTRLEALDRVLERILTIPDEEVPPQTTLRS
jgi:nucleotidyltransferase/DNA polymerase involved in DNA repair